MKALPRGEPLPEEKWPTLHRPAAAGGSGTTPLFPARGNVPPRGMKALLRGEPFPEEKWTTFSRHAAELETAVQQLEELRSMSKRVGEVVKARALPPETDAQILGRSPNLRKGPARVLATWSPEIPITASEMAIEISRRFGALPGRNTAPTVTAAAP